MTDATAGDAAQVPDRQAQEAQLTSMATLLADLQDHSIDKNIVTVTAMAARMMHHLRHGGHPGMEFIPLPIGSIDGAFVFGDRRRRDLNVLLGTVNDRKVITTTMVIPEDDISAGVRGLFRMNPNLMIIDLSMLRAENVGEALRIASQAAMAGHIVLLTSTRDEDIEAAHAMIRRHSA